MPPLSYEGRRAQADLAIVSAADSSAAPTPSQRFFQEGIFEQLLPSLQLHLKQGDLARLARVNSEVGTVAVKLYRRTTLRITKLFHPPP
jgi:hypothetical protein